MVHLPSDKQARKNFPIASGVLDYFPDALSEIARVSKLGNDQHNPGQPLHWSRGKSDDHADCLIRHFLERGTIDDDDGTLHSAKLAWRALALLQLECEARRPIPMPNIPDRIYEQFAECDKPAEPPPRLWKQDHDRSWIG
jgi:hypothetical protein